MKMRASAEIRSHEAEAGQAAALMALLLFFAFLALASLAIDGAMTYLARRDLQNVADSATLAACQVLANGGDSAAALSEAQAIIAKNLGSSAPFAGSNPPATNQGAGSGLVQGIEVSVPVTGVRVALLRPVPTVLTQFLGRTQTIIDAKARCDSTAGGGLLPIAIQRYDGTSGSMQDYVAVAGAPPYPSDSVTTTIPSPPARYPPSFQVPIPLGQYTASPTSPGPEVALLGQQAATNNGESSMRDLVLLDIRNVADQNALEYYNGAQSQADAAKYMSQNWIYSHGYPGPFPQIGSQIAILSGASTDFSSGAMNTAGYQVGDLVAAIVYDGYVWTRPSFGATLTSINTTNGIASSRPIDTNTAVQYSLNIGCPSPCPTSWYQSMHFTVAFDFSEKPGGNLPPGMQMDLDGVPMTPGVPYTIPSAVSQSGSNFTLRVWNTATITDVAQYLTGLNVTIQSVETGVTHGASSNFGFGTVAPLDFTLRSNHGLLIVRQGDSSAVNPITYGAGSSIPNGQGCKNVPASAQLLINGTPVTNWNSYFSSANSMLVSIPQNSNNTYNTVNFPLVVQPGATTNPFSAPYVLRITVGGSSTSPTCSGIPSHTEDIPLKILAPQPGGTPDKFVFIQGYTLFRVTRYDPPNSGNPNTVFAQAISPLYPSFSDIKVGLRARLVPWN
jgi:Flp pilus assembly protein TadG